MILWTDFSNPPSQFKEINVLKCGQLFFESIGIVNLALLLNCIAMQTVHIRSIGQGGSQEVKTWLNSVDTGILEVCEWSEHVP